MPITRYAKVLLLAPAIGSALIGVFGLLLGVALLAHSHYTTGRTSASAGRTPAPTVIKSAELVAAAYPAHPSGKVQGPNPKHDLFRATSPVIKPAAVSAPHPQDALFQKAIPSEQLGFLNEYAGRPANDVLREQKLRELVAAVVPYAPFHLGLDMPLPHALESMFAISQVPVEIREGRYVMVTGIRGQGGRGRAFIWVDTHLGIALGGIFFYPSNGEPTPTLTVFSSQVNRASLGFSQLPPAFVQDLTRWAAAEGLPPVTTRYFINASSEKTVLAHDQDFCKMSVDEVDPDNCSKMNADAAHVDTEASHFLNRVNYASNATMRTANDPSRIGVSVSR